MPDLRGIKVGRADRAGREDKAGKAIRGGRAKALKVHKE
jgi:hypothetical protein